MTGRRTPPPNEGPPNITRDTSGEPLAIPPASLGPQPASQPISGTEGPIVQGQPPTQPPTQPAAQPIPLPPGQPASHQTSPPAPPPPDQQTPQQAAQTTQPATTPPNQPPAEDPGTLDANDVRLLTLMGEPGALKAAVDLDLVHADPRTREKVVDFFQRTLMGDRFLEASKITGLSWMSVRSYCSNHPKLREIYEFSKGMGKEVRQCRREMVLDHRGQVGVRSPVYYKGKVVGHVLKPSDKCLELALKGGDVDGKYVDRQKTETITKGVVYHIIGVDRTPVIRPERPDILGE